MFTARPLRPFLNRLGNTTVNILVVFCHPRRNSFTGAIADAFINGARSAGHEVELADLYGEDFDPRLEPPDEPDWNETAKRYSKEVRDEMRRMDRNEAVVMVFPVWWWSMPAMLKGWIDRVWNLGWAYGPKKLAQDDGLVIGVAAASKELFDRRHYTAAFEAQIAEGILNYCGIERARSEILHDSTADDATRKALLARATELGETFPNAP
jgi:NAD(P)H dehydrogenase (quinone)